jgi:hypothetical protein
MKVLKPKVEARMINFYLDHARLYQKSNGLYYP